jgi:HAD superfamily hydrolase (TIGR01509 family)
VPPALGLDGVRAALFDLDGTLIDTEMHTETAVTAVVARYGIPGFALPHTETRGRTWMHVAETVRARTRLQVPAAELAAAMLEHWLSAVREAHPVPGAAEAVRSAVASGLKVAIVSSSPRSVIDYFAAKLGIADCVSSEARIGGDAVHRGKPDPECFLLAARTLGVEPGEAIVFEDSRAGLLAARAAGMRSMFITCCAADIAADAALATGSCTHYGMLPPRFWQQLAAGNAGLPRGQA